MTFKVQRKIIRTDSELPPFLGVMYFNRFPTPSVKDRFDCEAKTLTIVRTFVVIDNDADFENCNTVDSNIKQACAFHKTKIHSITEQWFLLKKCSLVFLSEEETVNNSTLMKTVTVHCFSNVFFFTSSARGPPHPPSSRKSGSSSRP